MQNSVIRVAREITVQVVNLCLVRGRRGMSAQLSLGGDRKGSFVIVTMWSSTTVPWVESLLVWEPGWITASSTDHAAWPTGCDDNGKRLTYTRLLPQSPCKRFALITGPIGGGLTIWYHGIWGCRSHQLPRCRMPRTSRNSSVRSTMAPNRVAIDSRPTNVTAKESQVATEDETSIALLADRLEIHRDEWNTIWRQSAFWNKGKR